MVRAAPDGTDDLFEIDEVDPVFDELFPLAKIEAFVKTVPSRMLTAKLNQQHPNNPLMFTHALNGAEDDSSHIHFLIAPVNDNE